MVKEKEKETGDFGQKIPPEPPEPPEDKTPTPDEQLVQAQTKIDELTKERDEKAKGLQTAHSKLTEKDKEIRKQADDTVWRDAMEGKIGLLSAIIAEQGSIPEGGLDGIPEERKQDLRKLLKEKEAEIEDKRKQSQLQVRQEEYYQRGATIYSDAEEVYGDDVGALHNIRNLIRAGDHDLAEREIAKAKGKSTDTKEKNVESEEDKETKIRENERQKVLEEHGLWKVESGKPTGARLNDEKIRENFRNNPNNKQARDAYLEYVRRTRGY